jgi:PAS domain S-box-containing protein
MWILDVRSSRFAAANKAALEQYGFSADELAARTVYDILPAQTAAAFLRDIARPSAGPVSRGLWQHCRKDRTLIDVEVTAIDLNHGNAPARLVIANDIGQRRSDEERERQIQKMEMIGQLAGGVANHFDDLLKTIEGRTSLLIQNEKAADCIEQLNDVSAAVGRATALTRQLLIASGRQSITLEPLELNGLLQGLSQMLRRLLGEKILLQNTYSAQMPLVLGNRQLLEHIIVNLILNARDAMQLGGTLTIHTSAARFAAGQVSGHPDAKAGEFVRLTVRDTGCGMPPEVQTRLFEPFFTTKEPGKGTGLGLASVYGAVKQQAGWIEFTSAPGSGTELRIFLPCAPATAVVTPPRSHAQDKKVILLVESEPRARGLAHMALNWHGYRVIEADCPSTALMFWHASKPKPDMLIADTILSDGTTGGEFAEQLRNNKVDLKVLFIGAPESSAQTTGLPNGSKFLSRPFNPKELVDAVQGCLDGDA